MEDPRLSRMYAKLLTRGLAKRRRRTWEWLQARRSALLTFGAIVAMIIFAAGYVAHLHGRFRRLKTELKAMGTVPIDLPPMPGGQEAIILQRTQLAEGSTPEFLSATLLPGRGLNVLQIMISIPGRGAIPLLAAPSLEDAATAMTGLGPDQEGLLSLQMGAPIEAPWAGRIFGASAEDGSHIAAVWHGRTLLLPASETGISEGGLLLKQESDSVKPNDMPDGGAVQGSFATTDFSGRWPSQTSVGATALLSSRAFELRLVARNEGKEPMPIGLGWQPRFALPSGGHRGVTLRLPAEAREEMTGGRASGQLVPVLGTAFDFTDRAGKPLRDAPLDETFVTLRSGFLESGPVVEVRDTHSGVGLRMTAMSPQIRAIHVRARSTDANVSVGFQTNYDDPFSKVWARDETASMHILQPGQTLQWKIRLELFRVGDGETPSL